jgi:phage tail protein X
MKNLPHIARRFGISALLLASAAHAEWVPVGPAGIAQFFMDKATIKRKADTVQVWELVNMEKVDGEGVHSSRFLVEYDCKGQRSRGLDMLTYTEPMGGGKLIQQLGRDPDGWEALPPDSIFSQRMQMACEK